jgi:hypothetical protein
MVAGGIDATLGRPCPFMVVVFIVVVVVGAMGWLKLLPLRLVEAVVGPYPDADGVTPCASGSRGAAEVAAAALLRPPPDAAGGVPLRICCCCCCWVGRGGRFWPGVVTGAVVGAPTPPLVVELCGDRKEDEDDWLVG